MRGLLGAPPPPQGFASCTSRRMTVHKRARLRAAFHVLEGKDVAERVVEVMDTKIVNKRNTTVGIGGIVECVRMNTNKQV